MTFAQVEYAKALSLRAVVPLAIAGTLVGAAWATEPHAMSYWVSMRSVALEGQPSFVPLSYAAQGEFQSPLTGCRNRTFYLTSADAAAVTAARNSGEVVQIHRGEPGSSPQGSTVICFVQAGQ